MWLFTQVRLSVKVREHNDHEEVLQETHDQQEVWVRTVLHHQRPAKVDEQDEELYLQEGDL